jgi:hypothetical protein
VILDANGFENKQAEPMQVVEWRAAEVIEAALTS